MATKTKSTTDDFPEGAEVVVEQDKTNEVLSSPFKYVINNS